MRTSIWAIGQRLRKRERMKERQKKDRIALLREMAFRYMDYFEKYPEDPYDPMWWLSY